MKIEKTNIFNNNVNIYNKNNPKNFEASFVRATPERFSTGYYDYQSLIKKLIGIKNLKLIESKNILNGLLRNEQVRDYALLLEKIGVTHPKKMINTGDIIYNHKEAEEMNSLKKRLISALGTGKAEKINNAQDELFQRAYKIAQKAKEILPERLQDISDDLSLFIADTGEFTKFKKLTDFIYENLAA